jgi:hypothetical protein
LLERSVLIPFCGCRIWEGYANPKTGYGEIHANKRTEVTHRASWLAFKGPIPEGVHVLHSCDVRPCINPDHLFLGTNVENIADSMMKGRRLGVTRNRPKGLKYNVPFGAHDIKLKVPRREWPAIAMRADTETQAEIARSYGVNPTTIHNILKRFKCA